MTFCYPGPAFQPIAEMQDIYLYIFLLFIFACIIKILWCCYALNNCFLKAWKGQMFRLTLNNSVIMVFSCLEYDLMSINMW